MIGFKSADQAEQESMQRRDQQAMQHQARSQAQSPIVDNLATYVRQCWEVAKQHKLPVAHRLTDCLRRRKGEYSAEKLGKIQQTGGSDIYMGITGTKCRAAKAWLSDLYNQTGDKPFSIDPTPISDLPPEIKENLIMQAMQGAMQLGVPEEVAFQLMKKHESRLQNELKEEAEQRMERMEDHIEDIFVEGNWRREFDEFLDDLVTYPTAVMSGINYKNKSKVKWVDVGGEYQPKKEVVLSREFERVSPFDAYPSPTTVDLGDSWFCQHIRYTPHDLANLRGVKGYKSEAIYQVLMDYRIHGHREWLFETGERDRLEGRQEAINGNYDLIDGVKFCGHVQGKQLVEWGMNPQTITDLAAEYSVSVIVVGNHTIRALINPDPSGRMQYYAASWINVPNSFWGLALPESISDIQDAANATARSLLNNMAIASAPQVSVDVSKLPVGSKITQMHPWKIWQYDSTRSGTQGAGVNFFMPETKANELLMVYERFERYADEKSGVPAYSYGSDGGAGAAKTSSGLSMLMNASSKTIKDVVRNIDINVIEPCVAAVYNSLMLDPDVPAEAKGDAQVKARGSDTLIHKESAAMRHQELLMASNNPTDIQIMGMDGRRELWHQVLKTTELPIDKILPTQEEMQQQQMAAMQQQGQVPPDAV